MDRDTLLKLEAIVVAAASAGSGTVEDRYL